MFPRILYSCPSNAYGSLHLAMYGSKINISNTKHATPFADYKVGSDLLFIPIVLYIFPHYVYTYILTLS